MDKLLKVNDLMDRYSISRKTITNYIEEGMPCIRLGKSQNPPLRFDELTLEWIENKIAKN